MFLHWRSCLLALLSECTIHPAISYSCFAVSPSFHMMVNIRVGKDSVYNIYIRVLYRENTIQYVSSGVAADWRQTRVPPQSKQTLPGLTVQM